MIYEHRPHTTVTIENRNSAITTVDSTMVCWRLTYFRTFLKLAMKRYFNVGFECMQFVSVEMTVNY